MTKLDYSGSQGETMHILGLKIDQDENEAGKPAGSGNGSQDGGNAGTQDSGAEDAAGDPAGEGAANQNGGNDKTNPTSKAEQFELVWHGQKKVLSREEVIALAQRNYNVTQQEQKISQMRKDLITKQQAAEDLLSEIQKRQSEGGEGAGVDDKSVMEKVYSELEGLKEKLNLQEWEKAMGPVKQKYPDINDLDLATEFQAKLKTGEVSDDENGLMEVAGEIARNQGEQNSKKMETLLSDSKNKTVLEHNDKVVKSLLANPQDARLAEYNQKVIADYIAGKLKLKDAGGEKGPGGTGTSEKSESIAEVAARLRS